MDNQGVYHICRSRAASNAAKLWAWVYDVEEIEEELAISCVYIHPLYTPRPSRSAASTGIYTALPYYAAVSGWSTICAAWYSSIADLSSVLFQCRESFSSRLTHVSTVAVHEGTYRYRRVAGHCRGTHTEVVCGF